MSIIDCTSLNEKNVTDWNANVIIHTSQIHGMPKEVRAYLSRVPNLHKVVLVTTSGGGDEVVSEFDVDSISTASRLSSIDTIIKGIISKLAIILETDID